MKLFEMITELLWSLGGHPLSRANDRMKEAAQVHARNIAEVKYHQSMIAFYEGQVANLDPHDRWWEFAAAKDMVKIHQDQLIEEFARKGRSEATLSAAVLRLKTVREECDKLAHPNRQEP